MEVDLSQLSNATPVDQQEPQSTQETKETNTNLPATRTSFLLGDVVPEFKDVILPRLNVVQGSGQLKATFDEGAIVFDQRAVLYLPAKLDPKTHELLRAAWPPICITILGFRPTRFAEKVAGGAFVRGLIVDTEDAVRKAGGTLDYKEWEAKRSCGMKRFEPLADALVAIERPLNFEDDDTLFVYPVKDKKYTLGLYAIRGCAYTRAVKKVFFYHRVAGCLREGYPTFSFSMSSALDTQTSPGNPFWVPNFTPKEKNTPEFLEFAKSVLNPEK